MDNPRNSKAENSEKKCGKRSFDCIADNRNAENKIDLKRGIKYDSLLQSQAPLGKEMLWSIFTEIEPNQRDRRRPFPRFPDFH
jgi:hypothetical protein